MSEIKHLDFELIGPPCESTGCKGVLINTISNKTNSCFQRCSICGKEFNKMSVDDKFAYINRVMSRVMKNEKT